MNSLIEIINQYQASTMFAIAGALIMIELFLFGVSGPLLFISLGSFCTGLLIHFGLIETWNYIILMTSVSSAVFAALLWIPLRKFQNRSESVETSSDMIGREVKVSEDITKNSGKIRHSGIDWLAKLSPSIDKENIPTGEMVKIVGIEGTTMIVQ